MGSCPGYELLTSQGEATKSCRNKFRERVGTTVERILAGEAREICKDRVAERKRVREKRRARVERGAGDVPEEPSEKDHEQVAVRHADVSGGYTTRNQHEEKRKRDIQVNERGSGATNEEQTDEWRKTVRFEQEAPNTSISSDPHVALQHPVRDETTSWPGSVLVQKSGHVDDDEHISALHVFYEKDGRENRCIGEVFDGYRGEDAGDLERSELLVENWRHLNDPGSKFWKSDQKVGMEKKSWKTCEGNQTSSDTAGQLRSLGPKSDYDKDQKTEVAMFSF